MINEDDIRKIAALAMLEIEQDDIGKFTQQFGEILDYMKEIDNLDLSDQEAAFHITKMNNVFREDKTEKSLDNETALSNAPEGIDGAFKVPRVI